MELNDFLKINGFQESDTGPSGVSEWLNETPEYRVVISNGYGEFMIFAQNKTIDKYIEVVSGNGDVNLHDLPVLMKVLEIPDEFIY